MNKIRKNSNIQIAISVFLVVVLLGTTYWIVNRESDKEKLSKVPLDGSGSEIISTDPVQTAASAVRANGTMGNIDEEITIESLESKLALYSNIDRRMNSLSTIEAALVPGSPLINGTERSYIKIFTEDLNHPTLYRVENMKAGKPRNEREIGVRSEAGKTVYKAVDVEVEFDSFKTTFRSVSDTSYDGTHTEVENKETYDVIVTLIQSGDLWFVYDIIDSEYILNERFATWRGVGEINLDYSKDKDVGYIQIPGITPLYEEEDGNNE